MPKRRMVVPSFFCRGKALRKQKNFQKFVPPRAFYKQKKKYENNWCVYFSKKIRKTPINHSVLDNHRVQTGNEPVLPYDK